MIDNSFASFNASLESAPDGETTESTHELNNEHITEIRREQYKELRLRIWLNHRDTVD